MTSHPNRSGRNPAANQIPALIADMRSRAGLTQAQCARMTLAALRTWQQWEAGDRAMPPAAMELWCLAMLAGKYRPGGDWVRPWVRQEFLDLFNVGEC